MTMLGRRQFGKLSGWLALGVACDFEQRGAEQPDVDRWDTAMKVARDLLLVGPDGRDLKLEYLKILIDDGLPPAEQPRKVLVLGAGIAGLAAATLLKRAGHDVTILEANADRIGGRIKTFRANDPHDPPFDDPKQYAEAGAMRLPDFHPLTIALIDKLGLPRRLFYYVDVTAPTPTSVPPVVYKSFTGEVWQNGPLAPAFAPPDQALRTWIAVNGERVRRRDYADDPESINESFGVMGVDAGRTAAELFNTALDPVRDYFSDELPDGTRENKPTAEWIEGWAQALYDFDGWSMYRYLTEYAVLDTSVVDAIGTIENATSRLPLGFMHTFIGRSDINPGARYWEIDGGCWRLPYALEPELRDQLVMNRRVVRIETGDGVDEPAVRVETVDEAGDPTGEYTADLAIVTIPFSALRHVEFEPPLSYGKRRAIIEMHYDSATKIVLEFSRRWWEFTEDDWHKELEAIKPGLYDEYEKGLVTHVFGGGSVTDNPNRTIYYPSHAIPGTQGGVLLASYTWADDASRWDAMDDDDRYDYALRGVQEVHGDRVEAFYTGRGQTQSWMRDPYAFGEAAVFLPGQMLELHPFVATPEGPLHFAGEHTSLKHAWVEGALESAVRAAIEVHQRE
ncbi:NAD(P)/FAD-dependent oxidoreductase [Nannocystis sp. SCPEA4]|uniref:flavin monoamine oxidase family protein n=1 Tax=Nannocystis sp. SCPEA4 TaxID=2996787 RepID=UPI002271B02C|nr:NAD(P)/FAD-dependent oxidoreductase [Nannocystis sp. SCPEA4]MCY1059732.1 NAD(P)/FAD-dependent oxidoreductase [Nannocystis sp. SCPEA4]